MSALAQRVPIKLSRRCLIEGPRSQPLRFAHQPLQQTASYSVTRNVANAFDSETIDVTFIRHGQSTWNKDNIFIGMTDTDLTLEGEEEARQAGKMMRDAGKVVDVFYTSLLRRSIFTVWLVSRELQCEWVPVHKDWRLNERNYGALVGRNKKDCVAQYGTDQVKRWRRSWDEPPPPMSEDHPYWPYKDRRYAVLGISEETIPRAECLKDVTKRTSQFWDEVIVPDLRMNKNVTIVGHENNLRSIVKRLDSISNEDIINIELPRAIPLVYTLDKKTLKPVQVDGAAPGLSGRYLTDRSHLEKIAERDFKQVYDLKDRHGRPPDGGSSSSGGVANGGVFVTSKA